MNSIKGLPLKTTWKLQLVWDAEAHAVLAILLFIYFIVLIRGILDIIYQKRGENIYKKRSKLMQKTEPKSKTKIGILSQ